MHRFGWWLTPSWGLQSKLALLLLVPSALIVGLLLLLFHRNLRQAIYQSYLEEGLAVSSVLEPKIGFGGTLPPVKQIQSLLLNALDNNTGYVQVSLYDVNGNEIMLVSTGQPIKHGDEEKEGFLQVISTGVGTYSLEHITRSGRTEEFLETLTPISAGGKIVAVFESYRPLGHVERKVDELMRTVMIVGPAGIGLLLLILFIGISVEVINPIKRLEAASGAVIRGRYDLRLPDRGHDELDRLAGSFNQMAAAVSASLDKEHLQNKQLSFLNMAARHMVEEKELDQLLAHLVRLSCRLVPSEYAALYLIDPKTGEFTGVTHAGEDLEPFHLEEQSVGKGLIGKTLREGKSVRVDNIGGEASSAEGRDGRPRIHAMLSVPLKQADGNVIVGISVANKIDGAGYTIQDDELLSTLANQAAIAIEKTRLYQQIRQQATTDGLTGLNNHREFQRRLSEEIERSQRYGRQLSLLLLDIDQFKRINDQFGHLAGDALLRDLAGVVLQGIRTIDVAARYGGEEFVVILPETAIEGARVVAERLRTRAAEQGFTDHDGRHITYSISIGMAVLPNDADQKERFIDAADKALYLAKYAGRNRVKSYQEFLDAKLGDEAGLRPSVDGGSAAGAA